MIEVVGKGLAAVGHLFKTRIYDAPEKIPNSILLCRYSERIE